MDQVIGKILLGIFERAKAVNERDFIKQQVQTSAVQYQQKLKKVKADHGKAVKELAKWEDLMLASIEGTCVFTPEQIKKWMDTVQQTADHLASEAEMLQTKVIEAKETAAEIMEQHQRLLSWAEMFSEAAPEEKRMIASCVIKAVTLTRSYSLQVEFNISEAQYLSGLEMG